MNVHPHLFVTTTVINFDDVPDGTAIDNHYAGKGVTFASVTDQPQSQWSAFARGWSSAQTRPSVVSVVAPPGLPLFDASMGGIRATFTSPQRFVSVDAQSFIVAEDIGQIPAYKPYIESFDAQGNFLQVTYGPANGDPGFGAWQTLKITSSSANISFVRFSSQWHSQTTTPHV